MLVVSEYLRSFSCQGVFEGFLIVVECFGILNQLFSYIFLVQKFSDKDFEMMEFIYNLSIDIDKIFGGLGNFLRWQVYGEREVFFRENYYLSKKFSLVSQMGL